MEIRNLNEENVETLKKTIEKIAEKNPEISYEIFDERDVELKEKFERAYEQKNRTATISDIEKINNDIIKLSAQIEELNILIVKIFGDHFLVNGRWCEPNHKF